MGRAHYHNMRCHNGSQLILPKGDIVMTRVTTKNLPDFYKATVGFDRVFDEIERTFVNGAGTGYPPYNIARFSENDYVISLAVAGFTMNDLEVTQDGNKLTVTGTAPQTDDTVEYLHKGIAGRSFERVFQIADHVEVVSAKHELGVLNIALKRNIPEELLPRKIEIK